LVRAAASAAPALYVKCRHGKRGASRVAGPESVADSSNAVSAEWQALGLSGETRPLHPGTTSAPATGSDFIQGAAQICGGIATLNAELHVEVRDMPSAPAQMPLCLIIKDSGPLECSYRRDSIKPTIGRKGEFAAVAVLSIFGRLSEVPNNRTRPRRLKARDHYHGDLDGTLVDQGCYTTRTQQKETSSDQNLQSDHRNYEVVTECPATTTTTSFGLLTLKVRWSTSTMRATPGSSRLKIQQGLEQRH